MVFEPDQMIPLREVPSLPILASVKPGKRLNLSTIFRWASKGVRGRTLETYSIGGATCTTMKALERFFRPSAPHAASLPASQMSRPAMKLREEAVEKQLDELGISVSPKAPEQI